MAKKVTKLKDIAEKAGVSLATASLVLRDEGNNLKFKPETRQRIHDAAKELGWRQNLLVKGIQTGKTKTIGVLVPPFDSFWSSVLVGIHREFAKHGYTPITLWRGDDTSDERFLNGESDGTVSSSDEGVALINTLLDRRVEAVIAWPTIAERYRKQLSGLSAQGIPLVLLEHEYDDQPEVGTISTDEEHGSRLAAEHLLELGHRNIAFLTVAPRKTRHWQARREKHFRETVLECPDARYSIWTMEPEEQDAVRISKELLASEDRPTAVFCSTDHEAQDFYWAALEMGVDIPGDISVVGYSDLEFAGGMHPPLTTVHQMPREIGRQTADLVLKKLDDPEDDSAEIKVACELMVRASTALFQQPQP